VIPGSELLVLLVPTIGAVATLLGIWAAVAIRRQVLLWRMQKWAAWYWEMARESAGTVWVDGYTEQAKHLDRHVRAARGDDAEDA
jgi:hypothetical protein